GLRVGGLSVCDSFRITLESLLDTLDACAQPSNLLLDGTFFSKPCILKETFSKQGYPSYIVPQVPTQAGEATPAEYGDRT
ncbi:MAG: hypothetical protein WD894_12175, partial [Pirellulales bacterium]